MPLKYNIFTSPLSLANAEHYITTRGDRNEFIIEKLKLSDIENLIYNGTVELVNNYFEQLKKIDPSTTKYQVYKDYLITRCHKTLLKDDKLIQFKNEISFIFEQIYKNLPKKQHQHTSTFKEWGDRLHAAIEGSTAASYGPTGIIGQQACAELMLESHLYNNIYWNSGQPGVQFYLKKVSENPEVFLKDLIQNGTNLFIENPRFTQGTFKFLENNEAIETSGLNQIISNFNIPSLDRQESIMSDISDYLDEYKCSDSKVLDETEQLICFIKVREDKQFMYDFLADSVNLSVITKDGAYGFIKINDLDINDFESNIEFQGKNNYTILDTE